MLPSTGATVCLGPRTFDACADVLWFVALCWQVLTLAVTNNRNGLWSCSRNKRTVTIESSFLFFSLFFWLDPEPPWSSEGRRPGSTSIAPGSKEDHWAVPARSERFCSERTRICSSRLKGKERVFGGEGGTLFGIKEKVDKILYEILG